MSRILSMMRACKPSFHCKLGLFRTGIYTGLVFNQTHVHLRSLTGKLQYISVYASATQAQISVIQKSSGNYLRQIFPRKDGNHAQKEILLLSKVLKELSHPPAGYLSSISSCQLSKFPFLCL